MSFFTTLYTAAVSRDLNAAVKSAVLKREGEGNQARYRSSPFEADFKQIEKSIDDKRKRRVVVRKRFRAKKG